MADSSGRPCSEVGSGATGRLIVATPGRVPTLVQGVPKRDIDAVQAAFRGTGADFRIEGSDSAAAKAMPSKPASLGTLGLTLTSESGACEFDSSVRLKGITDRPITVRVPMADGSVVEIQARVVEPAKK